MNIQFCILTKKDIFMKASIYVFCSETY